MPPLSSPSVCFPFVPRSSGSGYSASCSSFQPSIGSASQGLSQRPDPFFRPDQILLFLTDWFPVRSLRFCLFSFPVCSRSLFPASLPQPFHRCSSFLPVLPFYPLVRPCVRSLRFHPASFPPLSFPFAPVRLGLRYLVSVSPFPFFLHPPHSGFRSARRAFPLPLGLASCALFPTDSLASGSHPFGSVPSAPSSASVLGFPAFPFTAPGFASQLLLPFACLPSRVQAFPLVRFVSSASLRFRVTGHNDTP